MTEDATRYPLLGCSMGDPAGIGPEVTLGAAAWLRSESSGFGIVILGDPELLLRRAAEVDLELHLPEVASAEAARARLADGDAGPWILASTAVDTGLVIGKPRAEDGRAALECIRAGADLAHTGATDALVTAPVNKSLIAETEPLFRGHTEYLAARAGVRDPLMVFAGDGPHVALLTTHLPLRSALAAVSRDRIARVLVNLDREWARSFGRRPRIGVAGLNPHAGENGLLGREEGIEILPAIVDARRAGVDATGPYPADSVFRNEDLDLILAMYHDQGTIIAKRSAGPTVNVTLGLPYPRTSPDHGTANDIAGTGTADIEPMCAAIELAATLAGRKTSPGDPTG